MAEKRYAILIASSEYSEESGLRRLRCPENDVRAVDEILCSPDFGQFTETFVFRNAPSYEILPRLNSVLTEAGKDDLVLIYFSGHGKLNRLGHLCLATANTDSKALEATSIRASTIKSYFDLSYSRKKILLLDCCYSGAAGEEFARTKGGVDEELQLMSGGQGTFIMTASSGIQTSVEKESDQYGLFTKHLVQGIRSGEADKNEDGQVDMQELYEYVHEKVREEGAQEPMKWDLHVKGKLVVTRSGRETSSGHKILTKLRIKMLAANSLWQLREILYEIEEYLSKYPYVPEARLLKDHVAAAMTRAEQYECREECREYSAHKVQCSRSSSRFSIICFLIGLSIGLGVFLWFLGRV